MLLTLNKFRNLFPRFCCWLLTGECTLRIWYCPWKNRLVFFGSSHSREFLNIRSLINFYTKVLKLFLEKYFRRYCRSAFIGKFIFSPNFDNNWNKNTNFRQIFKIIVINDDSFLQMYRREMNFLTYWFLKINIQTMIYFNKVSSSSRAIFKSILRVCQNISHGKGLFSHVTI